MTGRDIGGLVSALGLVAALGGNVLQYFGDQADAERAHELKREAVAALRDGHARESAYAIKWGEALKEVASCEARH